MNPIAMQHSPRFSSIIPVHQVYDETRGRVLDKRVDREYELADEAVDHMETLVRGEFPYSRFKAPPHTDIAGQQALINEASTYRNRVLDRLRLIDPDFASDPHQRLVALSTKGDFFLLTGDDAQPILDADRLQDTVLDQLDPRTPAPTPTQRDENQRIMSQVDDVYRQQEARVREYLKTAVRRVQLHILAIPGGQSFFGQLSASMLGVPAITITDMTVS